MNFNFHSPSTFIFLFVHKNGPNKSCQSFGDVSAHKISLFHVDWYKFCIHLKSLNVRHFGMVASTGLKKRRRGRLPAEFRENPLISSEVISGGTQIDRQHGDIINLTFFFSKNKATMISCVAEPSSSSF
jgi:hypothetical protein